MWPAVINWILAHAGPKTLCKTAALQIASQRGDTDVVRSLLDAGIPVDNIPSPIDTGALTGTALYEAVTAQKMDVVLLLLERGADVNIPGPGRLRDQTPLLAARQQSTPQFAQILEQSTQ